MEIPKNLSTLFTSEHFSNYPKVSIPQSFFDERGSIQNLADGIIGDVAIISSQKSTIRANHVHEKDWHLSYLVSGQMKYLWKDLNSNIQSIVVKPGEMIYTPSKVPHKMEFLEESVFIAISELSRVQANYESDTTRLARDYFY
jgi:dTDP-4-dehydrorhamnose 3,5-epimerase-like enzyme